MRSVFGASSAARPRDGEMCFDREPGHCVRARRHLGRVPRRVEREARERSTGESSARSRGCRCSTATRASAEAGPRARRGRDRSSHGSRRASIMSFAPPPPSSSMPKAYAHPPVSPATERDAAAETSSDARGVLKVRASSRPHPARSLARHASVGKEKPSVRRPRGRLSLTNLPNLSSRE